MTTYPRSKMLGFAAGWVAAFALLCFCASHNNGILVYALLTTLVGLKRSYIAKPNGGCAAVCALSCGAALYFGPAGGAITGILGALALSTGLNGAPLSALPGALFSSVAVGSAFGFAKSYIFGYTSNLSLSEQIIIGAVVVASCLLTIALVDVFYLQRSRSITAEKRSVIPVSASAEFLVGTALATGVFALGVIRGIEFAYVLVPTIYLIRQTMADLSTPNASADRQSHEYCLNMVQSLVSVIEARESMGETQAFSVVNVTVGIAKRMGMSDSEIEQVRIAALLHDIGKLRIPDHVLLRPGKLAPGQYDQMKDHCELGQRILEEAKMPETVCLMVRTHHERWDGNGYPDRLSCEEIPIGSRILYLADVCNAMTSRRSYRPGLSIEQAVSFVRNASGSHFDPAIVEVFDQMWADGELSVTAPHENALSATTSQAKDYPNSYIGSEYIAMSEISQAVNSTLDLDKLLQVIAEKIKDMIPSSLCVLFIRDEDSDRMHALEALGINEQFFNEGNAEARRSVKGIRKHEGYLLPTPTAAKERDGDWVEMPSMLVAPLIWDGSIIGSIELYHTCPNAFGEEHLRLIAAIMPQVSLAIKNAIIYKQTSESAWSDALTGLYNARSLAMRLDQELNRAHRLGTTVSIIAMDLDNFKTINDTFGHQFGNVVLQEMAQLFLAHVRDYDLVCRYGGDEFMIVLPNSDESEALETARRIEEATDALDPYTDGEVQVRIGVSAGVAAYPLNGANESELIAAADRNMYSEKRVRKNKAA